MLYKPNSPLYYLLYLTVIHSDFFLIFMLKYHSLNTGNRQLPILYLSLFLHRVYISAKRILTLISASHYHFFPWYISQYYHICTKCITYCNYMTHLILCTALCVLHSELILQHSFTGKRKN